MSARPIETLTVDNRQEWRSWLQEHHATKSEIWLVFFKRHTGVTTLSYDDAVEEALCFGWIDSLVRRLDDACYARKFTPRKEISKWSSSNRRRYEALKARGLLAPAGLKRPPSSQSGDVPGPSTRQLPSYIEKALKETPETWRNFERLAPSYKRQYVAWIDSAKREETRKRRLKEVLGRLRAGERLGLK